MYYNTLDIDNGDKENLKQIISKILTNDCCKSLEYKDSNSKGYHVKMICSIKCDKCRFVFDDEKRFAIDQTREEKFRNVLFDNKEYFKPKNYIKNFCELCQKNGKTEILQIKKLSFEETIQKLKEGKIKIPFTPFSKKTTLTALYVGYSYLECSKCGWFKFVKNTEMEINNENI